MSARGSSTGCVGSRSPIWRASFVIQRPLFLLTAHPTPALQQAGDLIAARECFERAASGWTAQKSPWHAAKATERAADIARDARDWGQLQQLTARTAELYLEEGRPAAAAEALAKAARALEEVDAGAAAGLYAQAVGWLEDSGKDSLAGDTYRQAIAHLLRSQRWADAVVMLARFAASCGASGARASQAKAYLSSVVVWLHAGDAAQAWASYQDALAVDAFASSDEAFAAEAVLGAYRGGDAAAVAAAVKAHHAFGHLDSQLARLAKRLPQGADLGRMAAQLGGQAGGGEEDAEEDLT